MQLERKRKEFEKQGINIAALSYDSVEVLRHFAERAGISYPLLSDPDSSIIQAFGILNETIPPDHEFYGVPYPGEYLIGPDGVVQTKLFEEKYADRFTPGRILTRDLEAGTGGRRTKVRAKHLAVSTWASDEVVRGGNRFTLAAEISLGKKMHVYAPDVEGYIPIDWRIEEAEGLRVYGAEYPEAEMLHLPAIEETVPVYEGTFRLVRDVMIGQPKEIDHLLSVDGTVTIKGSLRYQACDDKVCYLPETVPLEWKVRFEEHDRTRAPEELRKRSN